MKSSIILFLIPYSLTTSCHLGENKNVKNQQLRNQREINLTLNGKKLYVNDSAQYSQKFIKGLRSLFQKHDSLILIDDTLYVFYTTTYKDRIFHNVQPTKVPTELPLAKEVIYRAEWNGRKYMLTLVRTNFTEIKFDFKIDGITTKKGLVILGYTFFLGDESVEENGEIYSLSQYLSDNWYSAPNQESSVILKVQLGSGERVLYHEHFPSDMNKDIEIILRRQ